MSLQLHRPDGKGGLEARPVTDQNWRNQLRSPRWGASLKGGKLPALSNPEMHPTSTLRSVLFWVVLALVTFGIIVVGYGSSFFSSRAEPGNRAGSSGVRGVTMHRALVVSGVLGLGTAIVFGAAALTATLFPNGGTVNMAWGGNVGFEKGIAMPAPMPMPAVGVDVATENEKGVVVGPDQP